MYSESGRETEKEGKERERERREASRLKWLMMKLYRLGRLLGIVLCKNFREI